MRGDRRVFIQRFQCGRCGKYFTVRQGHGNRYSRGFIEDVVRRHVEHRESYRVLAKRVYEQSGRKTSASTLNAMVRSVSKRCKSPLEMSRELKPKWAGYLVPDEKMVSVRGEQQWFYIALDSTGDVVHGCAVSELTVTEAAAFIEEIVRELEYPCRGVTTDLDTALTMAVEHILPGKPHQFCLKHAFAALEKAIGYRAIVQRHRWDKGIMQKEFEKLRDKKGIWVEKSRKKFMESYQEYKRMSVHQRYLDELRQTLHGILFARSEGLARERYTMFRLKRVHRSIQRAKQVAKGFLDRYWDKLMTYHRNPGMPRTNNFAENLNKQVERRVKTIEAFQSRESAKQYMNLLIAYLRQKPYTDCRGRRKHLNGKSRLEAAGVHLTSRDWLKYALKKPQKG